MFHLPSLLCYFQLLCRSIAVLVIFAGFAGAPSKATERNEYAPAAGVPRGHDGVNPVPLEIRNIADLRIRCTASLAHWFSVVLGEIESGKTLTKTLWHNPKTGEYSLMNNLQDRMPIEAIWCGRPPLHRRTSSQVHLDFRSGKSPAGITRTCDNSGDHQLYCSE